MTDVLETVETERYMNNGQRCEAGMFDASFACDSHDTTRASVTSCVVWLCATHRNVITIQPIAKA